MAGWRRVAVASGGSQIAEAALVLPIVFLLLLGIFWFGRAYNIYATINHAARQAARAATARSCATCGNEALPADSAADAVKQALIASSLDPSQVSSVAPVFCACGFNACSGSPVACSTVSAGEPQICVQYDVQLNPAATTPGSCGVSVSFRYPYQFYLPFTSLNQQQIYLTTQVQMKGEN
ncbi:MAG TPA: TadE family protein [Terriglobales bacterium]|jgi:Flp pilus assembly protein TadG|nr:TadE family protein [Terriglobales bacterium]